jgi:Ni,Fe-hydrogenase I large subunit
MCFKNLPIEFDAQGKAFLRAGVTDPYRYERREISRDQIKELMARNGFVRSVDFDPVTRIAGALAFHAVVDLRGRKVLEANIVTPSTLMASPKDPWGNPGPYEEAVLNTPILEEFEKPEHYRGIDILRTIRSFDPCMPCTTHIYAGEQVISQEVSTCACAVEG